ncbi:MAG: hypothetical protein ABIS67_11925, partial [Candidatus Eisenbacteria bacterium]
MRAARWFTFMALACLLLPAAPGASGFEEKRFNITPFVGYTIFDRELKEETGAWLSNDMYLGGRVSARLISPLWLDIAGGVTRTTGCNDEDILWT